MTFGIEVEFQPIKVGLGDLSNIPKNFPILVRRDNMMKVVRERAGGILELVWNPSLRNDPIVANDPRETELDYTRKFGTYLKLLAGAKGERSIDAALARMNQQIRQDFGDAFEMTRATLEEWRAHGRSCQPDSLARAWKYMAIQTGHGHGMTAQINFSAGLNALGKEILASGTVFASLGVSLDNDHYDLELASALKTAAAACSPRAVGALYVLFLPVVTDYLTERSQDKNRFRFLPKVDYATLPKALLSISSELGTMKSAKLGDAVGVQLKNQIKSVVQRAESRTTGTLNARLDRSLDALASDNEAVLKGLNVKDAGQIPSLNDSAVVIVFEQRHQVSAGSLDASLLNKYLALEDHTKVWAKTGITCVQCNKPLRRESVGWNSLWHRCTGAGCGRHYCSPCGRWLAEPDLDIWDFQRVFSRTRTCSCGVRTELKSPLELLALRT